jgi:hypothetical protein
MSDGAVMLEGVGGREWENRQGREIVPQNPNIECAGSKSVGDAKQLAARVELTYGAG